jgi:hypothetical protein
LQRNVRAWASGWAPPLDHTTRLSPLVIACILRLHML